MGNEDNKIKSKNEYEILVKDDFKTHFKGASQYIEFIDTKNKNENQYIHKKLAKKTKKAKKKVTKKIIN